MIKMSREMHTAVTSGSSNREPKPRRGLRSFFKSSSRTRATSTERNTPLPTPNETQNELSSIPPVPLLSTPIALESLQPPSEVIRPGSAQSSSDSSTRRQRKEKEEQAKLEAKKTVNPRQYGLFTLHEPKEDFFAGKSFPVDIIALHGVDGTPFKTWTHTKEDKQTGEKKDVLWLRDFLPQEFPGCRVYTYGYDAKVLFSRGTGKIESFARQLLEWILDKRLKTEERRRPIVFVAHSMGGLVTKKALIIATLNMERYRDIVDSTAAILFLATPHRGSLDASWAKNLAALASGSLATTGAARFTGKIRSDLLEGLRRDNPVVTDIASDFASLTNGRIRFYSFIEDLNTMPLKKRVVDDISGCMNIASEVVTHMAGEDHRTIARFSSNTSPSYLKVLSKLKEAVYAAVNPVIKTIKSEDRPCLKSLGFPSMAHRKTESDKSHTGTCTWILTHPSFTTWLNAPNDASSETSPAHSMLCIKGHPGTGKSTLMAFIYRYLLTQNASSTVHLNFFFTSRGEALQKNTLGMYRSLLYQVYVQSSTAREMIYTAYSEKKENLENGEEFSWLEDELRDLLTSVVKELATKREIILFMDALDEAELSDGSKAAMPLADFFVSLNNIAVPEKGSLRGVRVCISCRHYPVVGNLAPMLEIKVEAENLSDIKRYVGDTLSYSVVGWESEDMDLRKEIVGAVSAKAAGVFQWAVLRVPKIAKLSEAKEMVDTESNELFPLYTSIIRNDIANQARKKALLFLQWVSLATRPLALPELRFAMACDAQYPEFMQDSCERKSFIKTDAQMEKLAKSLSGGLAVVWWRNGVSRIQFVHETVYDFLRSEGLAIMSSLSRTSEDMRNILGESEDRLARSCVNYLRIRHVLEVTKRWMTYRQAMPVFLDYAVKNWYLHARQAERSGISQEGLAVVLDSDSKVWHVLMLAAMELSPVHWEAPWRPSFQFLHAAVASNLQTVVRSLLSSGTEVDERDTHGNTSLHYAAKTGQEELVKMLLGFGANINAKNKRGTDALEFAAGNGHGKVVEILLTQGMIGDLPQLAEALHAAVKKGSLPIVKSLLENGASPNLPARRGGHALTVAALHHNEDLIKILISSKAEIDAQDRYWGTALQAASLDGSEPTVRLLISLGADVNSSGSADFGPALQAAAYGDYALGIMQLLLESGAAVNARGGLYGTALQAACCHSSDEVVQVLLDNGADAKAQGGYMGTALIAAISSGSERKVQMLIDRGASLDAVGGELGNALQAAASKDNRVLVASLLSRGIDVNIEGGKYGSALQAAVASGPSCVEILLAQGARVSTPGEWYGTPLYAAVYFQREVFVRMLLERGADPNVMGSKTCVNTSWYSTVLKLAAAKGSLPIIKLLLDYGADVNAADEESPWGTALKVAVFEGHKEVAQMLLDFGADVEESVIYLDSPLYIAIYRGNKSMIEMLLANGARGRAGYSAEQMISAYRPERKAPAHY